MMVGKELQNFYDDMKTEAQSILAFWEKYAPDPNGGFYGLVDADLKPHPDAKKHIVLNARLIWTFAAAYKVLEKTSYMEMAKRARDYVMEYFIDKEFRGAFWELNPDGTIYDPTKRTYGEAFTIYGLAEYNDIFKDETVLQQAINVYERLENYAYDNRNEGYYEALTRDWKFSRQTQVSDINPYKAVVKTMNTHLHVLEAYTTLYKIWPNLGLKDRLYQLVEIMINKIINHNTWHFNLFFDEQWNSIDSVVSYGHDIEGSWLLWEAAEALDDDKLKARVEPISVNMAEAVFKEGWHENGGIVNEVSSEGIIDSHRVWWVQAEAVVGFFNAWQLTKEPKYLDAAKRVWVFINRELIDHTNGGWFPFALSDEKKVNRIDGWTCPYHNVRMCLEIMRRVEGIQDGRSE